MSLIEDQEELKSLPQAVVVQRAMSPPPGKGPIYSTLAVGEIQRRKNNEQKALAQQAQPGETVRGRVMGGALADLTAPTGVPMAGFGDPSASRPAPPVPTIPSGQNPQAAPPPTVAIGMQTGGSVESALEEWRRIQAGVGDPGIGHPELFDPANAMSMAAQFMGPDNTQQRQGALDGFLAQLMDPRMARAQLLAQIGSAIGGGRSPNFLTNLASANVGQAVGDVATRRAEALRAGLTGQNSVFDAQNARNSALGTLSGNIFGQGMRSEEANAELGARNAGNLADFMSAREGRASNERVANAYASRSGGGGSGGLTNPQLMTHYRGLVSERDRLNRIAGDRSGTVSSAARANAAQLAEVVERQLDEVRAEIQRRNIVGSGAPEAPATQAPTSQTQGPSGSGGAALQGATPGRAQTSPLTGYGRILQDNSYTRGVGTALGGLGSLIDGYNADRGYNPPLRPPVEVDPAGAPTYSIR